MKRPIESLGAEEVYLRPSTYYEEAEASRAAEWGPRGSAPERRTQDVPSQTELSVQGGAALAIFSKKSRRTPRDSKSGALPGTRCHFLPLI